jgi:hypothetical protein
MLFLSAMPHHHHGYVSCFDPSHCASEETRAGYDHDHPAPSSENDCLANFFAEVTLVRQQLDELPTFIPLHFTLPLNANHFVASRVKEAPVPPYRERLHAHLSTRVHAGRSPPFC